MKNVKYSEGISDSDMGTSSKNDEDYSMWESSGYQSTGGGTNIAGGSATTPTGILRLDLAKAYSPSTTAAKVSPIELKFLSQIEPSSPQPSIDRLSVTFAEDSTSKSFSYNTEAKVMDKVHFPTDKSQDAEDSVEEDYSGSVMAIMQRRASVRRSKKRRSRRGSSPFNPDVLPEMENGRRRSSVFTTSSGDTAITMEDSFSTSVTQEQIFENIKLHKEVLSSVKMQPWNMRRKLKLVQTAKAYIKKHEGALQERLAQSHSTKDILARWNIYLVKKLQKLKREMANLSNWLIPWELRIKEIESHFGSVVASYFIFLRWLFWVNIALSAIWIAFATVPELLTTEINNQSERKSILPEDKYNATNFLTLWDFEGVFKYSPMFYGWYTNVTRSDYSRGGGGYRLPLAYFFTGLAVYIFSFVATLRKMAENSRMSKLSEKEDECIFSWKLFTGWDYMIGNAETATNRVASIILGFKEALLEEAEKKREKQSWKIIGIRVLVNIGVLSLLALSAFAVIQVVARSEEKEASSTTWRRNEITVVMSLIAILFPMLFELLGFFEKYHPRKQLRLQLARIMVLNLLNLYSLIIALFSKIDNMVIHANQTQTQMALTSPINSYESYFSPETKNQLPLHFGSLLRDMFDNFSTMAETNLTNFTNTDFLNFITNTTLDFVNSTLTELSTTVTTEDFDNSKINLNDIGYDVDFTQVQDALQELFTNIFSILDNATTISINDTFFEETLSTLTTLLETTEFPTEFTKFSYDDSITSRQPNKQLISTSTVASTTDVTTISVPKELDYETRSKLRALCWETMFGQELVKLTIMDLILTLISILMIDFFRGLFVRYFNNCWCWDLEKKFPQYGDFKVAENILHLVNNQGMVWMGMFFSPGLVIINVVKLYIMMYLRSWAVLTCNVPHEVIFRASRSNNFYYALLLMMLFLCVLPVSYAMVWLKPSTNCGPFSGYERIYHIFTDTLREELPKSTHRILDYIASPGIVIPLLMLLILIIYYLISLSAALREANNDLKIQLRRERTEERRKMFQIVDRRRRGGSDGSETNNPFGKWKKLLREMPSNKSFEDTPKQSSVDSKTKEDGAKNPFAKFVAKAIKNRGLKAINICKQEVSDAEVDQVEIVVTPKEENEENDGTDTETHDSLPDDPVNVNKSGKTKKNAPKPSKTNQTNHPTNQAGNKTNKSRKDSNASNWSEVIPVITISKTESSECILEDKTDCDDLETSKNQMNQNQKDEQKSNEASPMMDKSPKIRYALKKQPVVEGDEEIKSTKPEKDLEIAMVEENRESSTSGFTFTSSCKDDKSMANAGTEREEEELEREEVKAKKVFQESSSNSTQTTDTRTESSTDYKDSTFSN